MCASFPALALLCAALLWPGAARAQTVLGLADVLARAREQAPRIVTARLAVAEARGRVTGASVRQMIGGLATSTLFTLFVLPVFYLHVHEWLRRRASDD